MEWIIASVVSGIVSGIVGAEFVRNPLVADAPLWPWVACTCVAVIAGGWLGRHHPWPWLILAGCSVGFGAHLSAPVPTAPWADAEEAEFDGLIIDGARPRPQGWSCEVAASSCSGRPCDITLRLRGSGTPPAAGSRVRARGRFNSWRPADASYLVDGQRLAQARGLAGSVTVETLFVRPSPGWLDRWRVAREADARDALGDEDAAMVLAIVTGSRGLASRTRRAPINEAGLGHLLAISGLHLVTVGGLMMWLLGVLGRLAPRRARTPLWRALHWLIPLAVVVAYAAVCGWPVSAQRAAAMFVVWRLGALVHRPVSAAPAIAAAVAVGIANQGTAAVFDPGLQLSVAAVAGIVLGLGGLSDPRWAVRFIRVPLLVTLASTAATAPLTLLHFGRLPLLGGLLNLVAVPLVQFIALPVGLAGFVLPRPLGDPLLWVSAQSLGAIEWLALRCPLSGTAAGLSSPGWLAAGLALAAALALLKRPRSALAVVFAASLLATAPASPGVIFVPVGQGDAIAVMGEEGAAILMDAGGDADRDVGSGVVVPALARAGARLEVIVVSHPDADHVGGLASVVRSLGPLEVWVATDQRAAPELTELLAAVAETRSTLREPPSRARVGDILLRRVDGGVEGSDNDRSVVYEAEVDGLRVLLTGDVERAGEAAAARATRPVHVFKVAHHGSRTSSTTPLLRAAHPQIGVITSGRDNRFGHPHPAALLRLRREGIRSWNTADCGHMEARARDGRLVLRSFRPCARE